VPHDVPFVFFDEYEEVSIYRCSLPHWRQDGVLYFVTFRLADSLPLSITEGWKEERRIWLAARGLRSEAHLRTLPRAERYEFARQFNRKVHIVLDGGHGSCWLGKPEIAGIVSEAFLKGDNESYALGDFVIMPNHVHVLVAPAPKQKIEGILKNWKGRTARFANQRLGRTGKFWQRESYDRLVRDETELAAFRTYIAANPGKANLREGQYLLGRGALFGEGITT